MWKYTCPFIILRLALSCICGRLPNGGTNLHQLLKQSHDTWLLLNWSLRYPLKKTSAMRIASPKWRFSINKNWAPGLALNFQRSREQLCSQSQRNSPCAWLPTAQGGSWIMHNTCCFAMVCYRYEKPGVWQHTASSHFFANSSSSAETLRASHVCKARPRFLSGFFWDRLFQFLERWILV